MNSTDISRNSLEVTLTPTWNYARAFQENGVADELTVRLGATPAPGQSSSQRWYKS